MTESVTFSLPGTVYLDLVLSSSWPDEAEGRRQRLDTATKRRMGFGFIFIVTMPRTDAVDLLDYLSSVVGAGEVADEREGQNLAAYRRAVARLEELLDTKAVG